MTASANYIFIADDFTGATDTLATLARAGLAVRLFLDVPHPDEVEGLDAFGIASEARALGNAENAALMEEIARKLAPHRPGIVHLKICSTFDSSPETGNFVRAMEILGRALGMRSGAILGGQPSLGRYCLFGHLFARAADGTVYRIDRHPIMKAHPVTPMNESDLARHVAALGGKPPRLVDRVALHHQDDMRLAEDGVTLFDAIDDRDIARVGAYLQANAPILCAGASSVAEAVVGDGPRHSPEQVEADGPVLAFVGSRSSVSADQVRRASAYRVIALAPSSLMASCHVEEIAAAPCAALRRGENVMICLDASASSGTPRELAQRSAALIHTVVRAARVGALAIAGGDTSSAIIRALRPCSIAHCGDIDPGVSLCMANFGSDRPLPIVLKGGQVGRPDLFDHLANEAFR
ncbi:four-carbon acid sugar kinase family protein [Billgrantia pellis]|uniref:four-carbon acid sugar kinase family protein n=1 Tax=Billgrantia pellis TaxID=2606936 RepID=UPI001659E6C8|nr:four-carbon acid sugar kinase family protein [Halomonas pellis]